MYKVVIIDDEPIILEGLQRGIAWEKWNCEVVGIARDGEEGQKKIRDHKPDLIISDISMPGMDGLEMVAGLKSEFPQMEIGILTGFRDFDYAQRAIRLGVTRFLLKPSSMTEIEEAIEAMVSNLKSKGIESSKEDEATDGKSTKSAGSFVVNQAMRYLKENYDKKLTLSEVAEQAFVSQWHLSKLLNKHMNQSFSEILNTIRIDRAKELLKDPALRIGEIAESVGFMDLAHFSRVFKKQTGFSANEYRNNKLK